MAAITSVTLNSGHKFPVLGLGTYKLRDETVCKSIVRKSLQSAYRLIDTASVYKNEQFIGDILSDKQFLTGLGLTRSDIFITTKVGPAAQGQGKCRESVLASLENLKLDYVDLVLIHWPGASGLDTTDKRHAELRRESWEDLEKLCKDGRIRSIGVSNYTVSHLEQLLSHCTIKPAVNQVEFHPLLYQKELLDFCQKNSIILQAYSSLGSADGFDKLTSSPVLKEIAKSIDKSVAQVLLKWALVHDVPVIPKTSHEERLAENLDLFSFDLSAEQMARIDQMNEGVHFCWNPNQIL